MRTGRRWPVAALALMALAVALFLSGPVPDDAVTLAVPALPEDLDAHLAARESRHPDIRPGAAKGIVWADDGRRARTPLAIVYVHGFLATRREVSPLAEQVSASLGANLFFTRLQGHGRTIEAMGESTLQGWMDDVLEAVTIGRRLGDRVVLMGTSTGAGLATLMALRPEAQDLHALILISPNYGLPQASAWMVLWPWGERIARLVLGTHHGFEAVNEEHARHWTLSYPVRALIPMMQTVRGVQSADLRSLRTPALVFYSKADTIVDPARIERHFAELGASAKRLVEVGPVGDPQKHVLAGDILSPRETPRLRDEILGFLRGLPR